MTEQLGRMSRSYGTTNINFRTGEALRRRGLAERYTLHVIKAEYVQQDTATDQGWASRREPAQRHEWYITIAGRAALAQSEEGK
jgi:hypothetical protein